MGLFSTDTDKLFLQMLEHDGNLSNLNKQIIKRIREALKEGRLNPGRFDLMLPNSQYLSEKELDLTMRVFGKYQQSERIFYEGHGGDRDHERMETEYKGMCRQIENIKRALRDHAMALR
jgi:hypothetical protein